MDSRVMPQKPKIVSIGHSHVACLQRAFGQHFRVRGQEAEDFLFDRINLTEPEFVEEYEGSSLATGLMPAFRERFLSALAEKKPDVILACIAGNQHQSISIAESSGAFDFDFPQSGIPLMSELGYSQFTRIPLEDVIAELKERYDQRITPILRLIREAAGCPAYYFSPPPPIFSEAYIKAHPSKLDRLLDRYKVSPAPFRLKVWWLNRMLIEELIEANGGIFIDLPPTVFDDHGFLAEEFRNQDPTHGNALYGREILQAFLEVLGQKRAA